MNAFSSRHSLPFILLALGLCGCSLLATRPVQEFSDTTAALSAARRAGAEQLAPDLFRRAQETYESARREYLQKNFRESTALLDAARQDAEEAEFLALLMGDQNHTPPPPPN